MQTYKGFKYRILRSSFGAINAVIVFSNTGRSHDFPTLKQAKRFISLMAE